MSHLYPNSGSSAKGIALAGPIFGLSLQCAGSGSVWQVGGAMPCASSEVPCGMVLQFEQWSPLAADFSWVGSAAKLQLPGAGQCL